MQNMIKKPFHYKKLRRTKIGARNDGIVAGVRGDTVVITDHPK